MLFKIQGHYGDVHKTKFFRNYVLTRAKNTLTGLAIHSKERLYVVDSGASLHMGLASLNHEEKKIKVKHSSG